jgi:hypothetical protein
MNITSIPLFLLAFLLQLAPVFASFYGAVINTNAPIFKVSINLLTPKLQSIH